MTLPVAERRTFDALDEPTRALVRLSATIAAGHEQVVRDELAAAHKVVPAEWIEELILQSYLFAGFPRALNAMREWRRQQTKPIGDAAGGDGGDARAQGEATCTAVYGPMYARLRENIRALHPLLDEWMIVEGYGKVLSRPGLDLIRRELCIVSACAASGQDRQLHSHLHGALNVGASENVVDETLVALSDMLGQARSQTVAMLWARVKGK